MTEIADRLTMTLRARRALTPAIAEFTLAAADGGALPAAEAGAHVTVQTPSGAMRRYTLVRTGSALDEYVIAVKREAHGRGGSASMHDDLAEGDRIAVEPPENDFPLVDAPEYLLIAGGVGVTPIRAMVTELSRRGAVFRMIYCARSAEDAAYLDDLRAEHGDRLTFHEDGGDAARLYDFWDDFAEPTRAHVYCCGPAPLMEEVRAVSGHWPEGSVHFEDFSPVEVVRADDEPFRVTLAATGETYDVSADRTILETLRDAGVSTVSSCESGTCGTCKAKLVSGAADHRDMVLMEEEKADRIMICVSRAESGDLVIDL